MAFLLSRRGGGSTKVVVLHLRLLLIAEESEEFLEISETGVFRDSSSSNDNNNPIFPPYNQTDWNGASKTEQSELKRWL